MTGPRFGRASAARRGRNPAFPYVPVIDHTIPGDDGHTTRTEQIRGKAFATRPEAVGYAQRVIDARMATHERGLVTPRYRALREQCGLPRDLVGVAVTTATADEAGRRPVGLVVASTRADRDEARAALGLPLDGLDDYSLVQWPDGRRWQRPEEIRIAPEPTRLET